jgi:hypothetical protein
MFETPAASLPPLNPAVKAALIFWTVVFIPWFPFMMLSGLAFEGGDNWYAYALVWSMWTYPIMVAILFVFRRWKRAPLLALLPVLNIVGCSVSGTFPRH